LVDKKSEQYDKRSGMKNYKKCLISRIENNVIWAKLKETIIIIALKESNEKVFKLNETAAYIWEHCDGKKNVEQLVSELCKKFAVKKATAFKDTVEFIEKMNNKNLISIL
jgi:hypothetical protein